MLKHHRGRYMAQFAGYMADGCGVMARAYVKRRTTDANAARPGCSNPALRQGRVHAWSTAGAFGVNSPMRPGSRCSLPLV